jgi:hypothetical protein
VKALPTRVVLATVLLAALLLAGVVSFYASSHPDGLERVATDHGFADSADQHAAAAGPLADYQVTGLEDPRLSGGLAGVAGAFVVLVLAGGLAFVVRRRAPAPSDRD